MRRVFWLILALAALFLALFLFVQGPAGAIPDYSAHPFHEVTVNLGGGDSARPIPSFGSDEMPVIRQAAYAFAIAKYPTAAACLGRADDAPWSFDAVFPWHRIRTPEQLEVCMFNVAREIGSASGFMDWLTAQSVSNRLANRQPDEGIRVSFGFSKTYAKHMREAGQPIAELQWPMLSIAYARTVEIDFSPDGTPVQIFQSVSIL